MKVYIGKNAYIVSWGYRIVKGPTRFSGRIEGVEVFAQKGTLGNRPYDTVETSCVIRMAGETVDIGYGWAVNDARYDKHTKEEGRRKSFTKALINAGFTRAERRAFWMAYWNRG
jgi:hypothetical protein